MNVRAWDSSIRTCRTENLSPATITTKGGSCRPFSGAGSRGCHLMHLQPSYAEEGSGEGEYAGRMLSILGASL
jgi:hypothetical protein